MRTYEKTHPWLKFTADLRPASPKLWVMLGECQSKCEHITNAPILPGIHEELLLIYLAKGAQATTAIEGNTLTEEEVRQHLRGELRLPPSKKYLEQEVKNIIHACNTVLGHFSHGGQAAPVTVDELREINAAVLKDLTLEDHVVPGEIRRISVGVPGYRGAPPEDCEFLLDRLCEWLNSDDFQGPPEMGIVYAIIRAVLAHLYIAWIHPFGDGNGRTARLLEFRFLMSSGVPHPAAHLLSNHYNQTRSRYYFELKRASQSKGDVIPFLTYAVQGFLDGLKQQVAKIQHEQWEVVWRDYVYGKFRHKSSESRDRQRNLVFALSRDYSVVPIKELPLLDPRLARAYARKTERTLSRDVNELLRIGLVKKESKFKVRANFEAISGYISITVGSEEE
ncbi:MAG: Fic family protein [Pseudomonadota bacterium]